MLHFRILDFGTAAPSFMMELIRELGGLILAGHVLYIHCFGGHGRTGQVAINLLTALYGVELETAWAHANAYHTARAGCEACARLPEVWGQKQQLKMLGPTMRERERQHFLGSARGVLSGSACDSK